MQHKNVVTFAVLVLASFSIHASKPCPLVKGACAVKTGVNTTVTQTTNVLDNKNVNRLSNAIVLGTAAYYTYKFAPDFFKQARELVNNRFGKTAFLAPVAPEASAVAASSEGLSAAASSSSSSSSSEDLATAAFIDGVETQAAAEQKANA